MACIYRILFLAVLCFLGVLLGRISGAAFLDGHRGHHSLHATRHQRERARSGAVNAADRRSPSACAKQCVTIGARLPCRTCEDECALFGLDAEATSSSVSQLEGDPVDGAVIESVRRRTQADAASYTKLKSSGLVYDDESGYHRWSERRGPYGAHEEEDLEASTSDEKTEASLFERTGFRSVWTVNREFALGEVMPNVVVPNGPQRGILLSQETATEHLRLAEEATSDIDMQEEDEEASSPEARLRLHQARHHRVSLAGCERLSIVEIGAERQSIKTPGEDVCLFVDPVLDGDAAGRRGPSGLVERFRRLDPTPEAAGGVPEATEAGKPAQYQYLGRLLSGSGGVVRDSMTKPPTHGIVAPDPRPWSPDAPRAPVASATRAQRRASPLRELFDDRLRALYGGLAEVDAQLRPLLERAAAATPYGHVVTMAVNFGQADLLLNFFCSARRAEIPTDNIIVFTTGPDLSEELRTKGVTVFDHPSFGDFPDHAANAYGDRTFGAMMFLKSIALWLPLRLGFDTLFQDADLVWLQDPLPYFDVDARVDSYWMDDGARSARYTPFFANSGFMFLRSNHKTRRFAREVISAGDLISGWGSQQTATSQLLNDAYSRHGLVVSVLPKRVFVPGQQFHRNKALMRDIVAGSYVPIVFHMCWTANKKEKLKYLKEDMLMWYLGDEYTEDWLRAKAAVVMDFAQLCKAEA